MIKHLRLIVPFLLFVISTGCAHKQRIMHIPSPIEIRTYQNVTTEKVRQAVLDGMHAYNWLVEREEPGAIIANQRRGSHLARVRISYSRREVQIAYMSSDNLNYRVDQVGNTRIHGTYNTWINNLERSIASRVNAL